MKTAPRKISKSKTVPKPAGPKAIQLRHWLMFWTLVLCVMIVINASFAKYQKPSSDVVMETDLMAAIADSLEKQADVLEEQAEQLEQIQPVKISNEDVNNCTHDKSPASSYVLHIDPLTSVSVSIPYNTKWSKEDCELVPVERSLTSSYFNFGPGDQVIRDASFNILPTTSTASILARVRAKEAEGKAYGSDMVSDIRQRTVSGLTVISYNVAASIGYEQRNWIAIGRNYVYEIQSKGWLTDAEAIKIIQSLRVTR